MCVCVCVYMYLYISRASLGGRLNYKMVERERRNRTGGANNAGMTSFASFFSAVRAACKAVTCSMHAWSFVYATALCTALHPDARHGIAT